MTLRGRITCHRVMPILIWAIRDEYPTPPRARRLSRAPFGGSERLGTNMAEIVVRKALVGEAAVLRSICLQSKRSWGYSDEFMTRFSEQTIIDADSISTDYVVVACQGETIIGWLRMLTNRAPMILDDLWVLPTVFGKGVGRLLFTEAISVAKELGQSEFELDSDPNAQGFYERMGCMKVGETFSSMGRYIPRMRYAVASF
jgi:predicted GNAT family N-acyltransferase